MLLKTLPFLHSGTTKNHPYSQTQRYVIFLVYYYFVDFCGIRRKKIWLEDASKSHFLPCRCTEIFSCHHHNSSSSLKLSFSSNLLPTLAILDIKTENYLSGSQLALLKEDDKGLLLKSICACSIIKGHFLPVSSCTEHVIPSQL